MARLRRFLPLALVAAVTLYRSVGAPPPPPLPEAVANAAAGTFKGYVQNDTRVWRGVPYAEPPINDLRWRKTVPKAKLTSPLDTKSFGSACAQVRFGGRPPRLRISDRHT